MPFVYQDYVSKLTAINPALRQHMDPALEPLNRLLQTTRTINPIVRPQILENLGMIPADRQLKYANALNYARLELNLGISIPYAYPINLSIRFHDYQVSPGAWSNDPQDHLPNLWYSHVLRLSWISSNGNLQHLAGIQNREHVTYIEPGSGLPFRRGMLAHTPQAYASGVNQTSQHGIGDDDHLFMNPSVGLHYPVATGVIHAEQEYQYSPDGGQSWYPIPGGHFLFERGVRQSQVNGQLAFYLYKRNWQPLNNRHFHFEVEYPVGPQVANPPVSRSQLSAPGRGTTVPLNTYATVISQG